MIVTIGGGTMGAGIATAFLTIGEHVILVETADPDAALGRVTSSLERLARRNERLDVAETLARLDVRTELPSPLDDAELIIEAIPEILEAKRSLFAELGASAPEQAVLATNTSSLSITAIAEAAPDAGRCIGMHFFNPVPVSELVEIVVGAETDQTTTDRTVEWVRKLGKTPIVVTDAPGFASSRLGIALGMEAIRMVEDGVASAEDIDTAMQLGYKHPMGPLRLTDLVGLDVRLAIADHLATELGPRFEPPALLRRMVDEGRLGKKSGQGFYDWTDQDGHR